MVAQLKLPLLRDPARLRPWLYAVARNEGRRRLHGHGASVPLADDEFGDGEATADLGPALEQAWQREMVWSALAELERGDQEIVELHLRHEFYGADLADALGVPRNQVHTLTSRARTRFETALGAHVVARSRLGSCPELSAILGDWDGDLTPNLRRQVRRHIGACEICGEHERRHVNPVAMLSALPDPVLPESLQHEALSLLADTSPDAAQERAEIAERAEPFTRSGFPVPLDPLASRRGPGRVRAGRRGAGRGVRDVRRRGHARSELTASHAAPGQFRAGPVRPVRGRGARGEHAQALDLPVTRSPRQARRRGGQRHRVLHARRREVREVLQAGQSPVLGGTLEVQAHLPSVTSPAPTPSLHADDVIAHAHVDRRQRLQRHSGRSSAGCSQAGPSRHGWPGTHGRSGGCGL